jgi:hypothetical protein
MIEYRGCCPSEQVHGGPQYQEYITERADQKYGDHIVIERWHEMILWGDWTDVDGGKAVIPLLVH